MCGCGTGGGGGLSLAALTTAVERVDEGVVALLEEGVELAAPVARHLLQAEDGPLVGIELKLGSEELKLGEDAGEPAAVVGQSCSA